MDPKPIVFILGPSGVGKTTLGDELQREVRVLHILFDGSPGGDGVDVANLRAEWKALIETRNPQPLSVEVRRRIDIGGHSGAVISCPSGVVPEEDDRAYPWQFPMSLLARMETAGVRCAVLLGPLDACMVAAMNRTVSDVTVESWCKNNATWKDFRRSVFAGCVLDAFRGTERRPLYDLVQEFRSRFLS